MGQLLPFRSPPIQPSLETIGTDDANTLRQLVAVRDATEAIFLALSDIRLKFIVAKSMRQKNQVTDGDYG
jgi:hypothetical protein